MSYVDSPSARFLFAILKQKSLKDIDWNQVARDPVLAQPITNGHAARMRFSRLRTVIQGPTKKPTAATGPANDSKFRITKSKKEARSKKLATASSTALEASHPPPANGQPSPPPVKPEPGTESPMFSPHMDERLLTPCSDDAYPRTPLMPQTPDMTTHPAYFLNPMKAEYAAEYDGDDSLHDDRTHMSALFGTGIMGAYPSNFESAFTAITGNEVNCDLSATQGLTQLSDPTAAAILSLHMPAEDGRNYDFRS